jgi:hypothetical protein
LDRFAVYLPARSGEKTPSAVSEAVVVMVNGVASVAAALREAVLAAALQAVLVAVLQEVLAVVLQVVLAVVLQVVSADGAVLIPPA